MRMTSRFGSVVCRLDNPGDLRPLRNRSARLSMLALELGGITAVWFAARLLARVSDHRLERAIAVLLIVIAEEKPRREPGLRGGSRCRTASRRATRPAWAQWARSRPQHRFQPPGSSTVIETGGRQHSEQAETVH